jgi:hypothetical protein
MTAATCPHLLGSSSPLTAPPPAEKATARQDQARQAPAPSIGAGTGLGSGSAGVAKIAPPTLPSGANVAAARHGEHLGAHRAEAEGGVHAMRWPRSGEELGVVG